MPSDPFLERLVVRPQIDYFAATRCAVFCAMVGGSIGFFASFGISCFISSEYSDIVGPKFYVDAMLLGILSAFAFRLSAIFIFCVRLYQRHADAEVRLRCRQTPTCSEYAILAIQKYGALIGAWKSFGRLRRCRPPGRVDFP